MNKYMKSIAVLSSVFTFSTLHIKSANAQYYNQQPVGQVQVQQNYQTQNGYVQPYPYPNGYNQGYQQPIERHPVFYGVIVDESGTNNYQKPHILGGLLNGLIGNNAYEPSNQISYTVRFDDGSVARILQIHDLHLEVGQPVEVVGGPRVRIIATN
jgi:hypothetical protein